MNISANIIRSSRKPQDGVIPTFHRIERVINIKCFLQFILFLLPTFKTFMTQNNANGRSELKNL